MSSFISVWSEVCIQLAELLFPIPYVGFFIEQILWRNVFRQEPQVEVKVDVDCVRHVALDINLSSRRWVIVGNG